MVGLDSLGEFEELEAEREEDYGPTLEHDIVADNIYTALRNFLDDKDLGRAFGGSAEYRFLRLPGGIVSISRGRKPL